MHRHAAGGMLRRAVQPLALRPPCWWRARRCVSAKRHASGALPLEPVEEVPGSGLAPGDPPLAPGLYVVGTPIGNLEDIRWGRGVGARLPCCLQSAY